MLTPFGITGANPLKKHHDLFSKTCRPFSKNITTFFEKDVPVFLSGINGGGIFLCQPLADPFPKSFQRGFSAGKLLKPTVSFYFRTAFPSGDGEAKGRTIEKRLPLPTSDSTST